MINTTPTKHGKSKTRLQKDQLKPQAPSLKEARGRDGERGVGSEVECSMQDIHGSCSICLCWQRRRLTASGSASASDARSMKHEATSIGRGSASPASWRHGDSVRPPSTMQHVCLGASRFSFPEFHPRLCADLWRVWRGQEICVMYHIPTARTPWFLAP